MTGPGREGELDRRFRLIAFDWDGTAVASRRDDATPVRGPIERLLRCGVLILIVTGTNLGNIDGQLSSSNRGRRTRNLFVATNRGSEVYGFDEASRPVLLARRIATAEEELALTQAADDVAERLRRTGLEVSVIYDRLNRRKVDLIPVEAWRDPPKSAFPELLLAVETRLQGGGIRGGIGEVVELARTAARARGLPDARITSDVKHVEIGLTDKSDSMAWMRRELASSHGIPPADILIGGDEFGSIAGFPGSDSRMLTPDTAGATVVSVGREPGGVPPGVIHLGGGPPRFRALLSAQAALHPVDLPGTPERDPEWVVVEEGFVVTREHEVESLFAIGNGYLGSRGSLAEGTSALSAAATFAAGVYDADPGGIPALVRLPDWATVFPSVDGAPLRVESGEWLEHRRTLDLRQALLWRDWRQRDASGRITHVRGVRFASLADRHLLAQSATLEAENYGGTVSVEAPALSGSGVVRTASGITVAWAETSHVEDPGGRWAPPPPRDGGAGPERWSIEADLGRTYRLDRLFAVHTSRDGADPLAAAREHVARAGEAGIDAVVEAHVAAWRARWDAADVAIEGDPDLQRAIRFAVYHLVSSANPDDERVSIGARGLTGHAYAGHVFWDTEIYMLPFFALTFPAVARALLAYRHHTLPAARARAARLGYQGALYAWESADTGADVTPPFVIAPDGEVVRIRVGELEQHISADVAYGVWGYWQATADERFLLDAGAEILLETARFWASRAAREEDDRWHIRGVIGPDEYHEAVDDDAYTNGMARWNLEVAAEVATLVAARWPDRWDELRRRVRLRPEEPEGWLRVAQGLYTGLDPRTGLIEQFQGYFGLDEIDLRAYEPRTGPLEVLVGRERLRRSKIVKQPDVLMLLYLLWDRFTADVREVNFRYYEPRTGHGSSLSPPIHAAFAARLGHVALAERYLRQTAAIDLANKMGNAAGGVHAAALGGLWQAVVFGFAGLELAPDGPRVHPRLPARWKGIRFRIRWRGTRYALEARPGAPGEAILAEAVP